MALYPNLGGTTQSSFRIRLAELATSLLTAARIFRLPDLDGDIPVVDPSIDEIRWGTTGTKTSLRVPVQVFFVGELGDSVGFDIGLITIDRTIDVPNESGLMSLYEWMQPDAISGLQIRTTTSTIIISQGYAITDTGNYVRHAGGTIASSRTANTTYHLYLHNNGNIERVTVAPDTPFYGSARGRTGTTSRRYIGSVRTDASGNYLLQQSDWGQNNVRVTFLGNTGAAPLAIHGAGAATAAADVNASPMVYGPTATSLRVRVYNNGGASAVRIYSYTGSAFTVWTNLPVVNQMNTMDVACDTTPKIQYDNTAVGGTASINLMGYEYAR